MAITRAGGHVLTEHGWELAPAAVVESPALVVDVEAGNYCGECDREFKNAAGLAAHQRAKHEEPDVSEEK